MHRVALSFLALGFPLALLAATLRVPEDYDTVERALDAAAPGDTVQLAAGQLLASAVITKSLTLRGAGASKTRLLGRSRDADVIAVAAGGNAVTLEGFTLLHPPRPAGEADDAAYASGLSLSSGNIQGRDLHIENSPGCGLVIYARADLADVAINGATRTGIILENTPEGTRLDKVSVTATHAGYDIEVRPASRVAFGVLHLTASADGPMSISGEDAAAIFIVPPATDWRDRIAWQDGAAPGVIPPPPPPAAEDEPVSQDEHFLRLIAEHLRTVEPARRQATRDLQAALRRASAPADKVRALEAYSRALLATYSSFTPNGSDYEVDTAIRREIAEFISHHGTAPFLATLANWTPEENREETFADYFARIGPPELSAAMEAQRTGGWMAQNGDRLNALYARLQQPVAGATPAASATDYLQALAELEALGQDAAIHAGPDELLHTSRQRAIEIAPQFLSAAGPEVFARILKKLPASPAATFMSTADLQSKLSADQRRTVLRALLAVKD